MDCPESATLRALRDGQLSSEEASRLGEHIRGCERCQRMDAPTAALPALSPKSDAVEPPAPPAPLAHALPSGTRIGRYLLLELLGAGGMGEVYTAYDPQLDRRVALKLLRPELEALVGATEGRSRLLREAQALARLQHPNVVSVHDVGAEDGQLFLAMEYVQGKTLGDWLEEAPRSWREVRDVFLQAGRGLAAAHTAGLVHRDFKPGNVLVAKDGRVCVLDFGLARPADLSDTAESTSGPVGSTNPGALLHSKLTTAGLIMGTPAYMAPEQFAGHPPDARTDQFSFGVALYEALYRTLPFRAATGEQRSEAIAAGRFEPPPASAPPVPAWLRRVVLRALAPRPEERFPDMGALLRELSADPDARRRRTMILLSAAASAVAVVGLAIWAPGAWRERQARECRVGEAQLATVWDAPRQATLREAFLGTRQGYAEREWGLVKTYLDAFANDWTGMHRVACEDTRVKGTQPPEMMERRLACLDQQLQNLRATVQQFEKVTSKTLERAAFLALSLSPELKKCEDLRLLSQRPALPESPEERARVQPIIGEIAEARALMLNGDFAQAAEISRASVTHAQEVGHRPLLAAALYVQGMIDVMRGENASAEESLYRAGLSAYAIHDDTITALAWMQLGNTLSGDLNRPAEGARWFEAARAAIDRLGGSADLEEMMAANQGIAEYNEGNVAQAATFFEQSLALAERIPYANPHRQITKLISLANCYQHLGRDEEAVKLYRRALAMSEAVLGPEHPQTLRALSALGGLLDRLGSSAESLSMLERAVAANEQRFGSTHVLLLSPLASLAEAYFRHGDLGRARASFERALSITLAARPPMEQDADAIKGYLARLDSREGRFREALKQLQAVRVTLVARRGEQDRALHAIDAGIAECHLALGRPAEALPLLERVLTAYQQKGADTFSHSYLQLLLARTLEVLGRDEARVRTLRAEAERLSPGQRLPEALERALTSQKKNK